MVQTNSTFDMLEFSHKYDKDHAEAYLRKHQDGFLRRMSNARDIGLAKKALIAAGNPRSILDIPCGTGRFWSLLNTTGAQQLIAADSSGAMLQVAKHYRDADNFGEINASAFAIPLSNESIDSIFCMRLLHHLGEQSDRYALLTEFHRVCRETVCVSLWIDGNLQAYRRKLLERRRNKRPYQNRFVITASAFESECQTAGFSVVARFDMLRWISMWRVYVLVKI